MAPRGLCENSEPHLVSPVFHALSAETREVAVAAVLAEPRTTLVERDDGRCQFALTARSRLMGFVDDIDLLVVDQGAGRTALALYSRSRIGYSDMGVNEARGRRILERLSTQLRRAG